MDHGSNPPQPSTNDYRYLEGLGDMITEIYDSPIKEDAQGLRSDIEGHLELTLGIIMEDASRAMDAIMVAIRLELDQLVALAEKGDEGYVLGAMRERRGKHTQMEGEDG